jgi:predicted flap endonuclease-1-like 5' DNA nuclease
MSSFLWLLLYLAPLLGLTAALFAWFGWHWRGSDMQKRIDELTAQIDRAQDALHQASTERAAALSQDSRPAQPDTNADEIQALRNELKSAQTEARLRQDEAAKAHEAALTLQNELKSAHAEARLRQVEAAKAREATLALETEMARLLADLEHLRTERTAAQAELVTLRSTPPAADETATAPAPVEPDAPAKSKRKRATPAKVKAPAAAAAPIASLREKITALEAQLTTYQAGLATLTQERDDWQRRISKLEGKSPADVAGLGLARRSLADSDKRLATATAEIERLQNQTRVLLHAEETAAALSAVPDDDLTQIKGIKKITSDQLRAHGIRTWRQIALWDEDEKRAFSEILAFKNRAKREQWRQQARTLHEAAHGPLT